jgi:hypothetical protein
MVTMKRMSNKQIRAMWAKRCSARGRSGKIYKIVVRDPENGVPDYVPTSIWFRNKVNAGTFAGVESIAGQSESYDVREAAPKRKMVSPLAAYDGREMNGVYDVERRLDEKGVCFSVLESYYKDGVVGGVVEGNEGCYEFQRRGDGDWTIFGETRVYGKKKDETFDDFFRKEMKPIENALTRCEIDDIHDHLDPTGDYDGRQHVHFTLNGSGRNSFKDAMYHLGLFMKNVNHYPRPKHEVTPRSSNNRGLITSLVDKYIGSSDRPELEWRTWDDCPAKTEPFLLRMAFEGDFFDTLSPLEARVAALHEIAHYRALFALQRTVPTKFSPEMVNHGEPLFRLMFMNMAEKEGITCDEMNSATKSILTKFKEWEAKKK